MTDIGFRVGELIENRYRVLSVIGSGGMGTLYRVSDETRDGEVVALKTVRLDVATAESHETVERFRREFQLLTQLRHPNLVSVYDYGVTGDGELYFTMEWVEGRDLECKMGQLEPAAVAPVVVQICRALAYLHARGVIHGDLKPSNILMAGDEAKIVDFGVALETRSPEIRARYYTPGYSAPEVKEQRPVDHRADLYSLGALWYALLMGEPPLFMPGSERLIAFALEETLGAEGQTPVAIGDVVARLLATSPEERYGSANEVIEAVNEATGSIYALETRDTASSYALRVHFVDREAEVEAVQTAWGQARSEEGRLVLISGESGVGKTRLVEELEVQAELEGARVVWGQCVESGGRAYHPWREVLRVLVRYVEGEDETAMRQMGPVLATLLPELWERGYMAEAAPPAELDPPAAQQRLHDTIARALQRAAALRPTVVVIEDAHWADEATLELLSFLARVPGLTGLLVCITYRGDEVSADHPLTTLAGEHVQRIEVKRLSTAFTTELARSMLGLEELPVLLTERLHRTTGGNALFVQELIRSLAAEGEVLRRTVDGWQVDRAALREARLPESIRQVVERRLEQLSVEGRQVLQWAAATGMVFWEGAVAQVGQVPRKQVRAALREALEQALVVVRDESALAGEREYLFNHPTVREVTYGSIAQQERRSYHDRAAAWLMARRDEEVDEHLGLIADHLERAGQAERAVVYLRRAGEQAATQFANAEAIGYFSRALDLTPEEERAERYALLLARERVYDLQGAREAQAEDLAALKELAEILDKARQAEASLRRAAYAEAVGDYLVAIAAAQAAIDLARAAQDAHREAVGYMRWGEALWRQGEYKEAQVQLEQALRTFREMGDRRGESQALNRLGDVAWTRGDYEGVRAYCDEALRICRETGDRQGESQALNRLGNVCREQGDYSGARAYFEQTLDICREMGDRRREGMALGNLGVVSDEQGDYAGARAYYEQALRVLSGVGDRENVCGTLANLGLLFHHLGDDEAAREHSQQGVLSAQEIGTRRWQGYALTNLGHALVGLGHLVEAAESYRQAVALRRELDQLSLAMESLAGLARVSLAQGDLTQALACVEEILRHEESDILEGTDEPLRVYLTCYRVLWANQDPRARAVLEQAYHLLQERAARIGDESLRRSFLENVAANREIVGEFAKGE